MVWRKSWLALMAVASGQMAVACGSALAPHGPTAAGGHGGAGGVETGGAAGAGAAAGMAAATGGAGSGGIVVYPCVLPASGSSGGSQLVATIRVSASTNTGNVDVAVYADGSAVRTVGPPRYGESGALGPSPETYPPASEPVMMFLCDLQAAGEVSQLATATGCSKSVSFGTTTTITVGTETSGDLQCLQTGAPATTVMLAHDCHGLTGGAG